MSAPTLTVRLNGDELELAAGSTVADVVAHLTSHSDEGGDAIGARGIAVAVDRCVIPRSQWTVTALRHGTLIEVVTAAAGG